MDAREFAGRNVLVMGLGRFGGGVGVTRWLARQGARVTVTDMASQADLADSIDALADLPITYRFGKHRTEDLDGCDLLVVNPAVNKDKSDYFKQAVAAGIPWTAEMNLFFERCPAPIIGITGTSGKSTTTAMLYDILRSALSAGGVTYTNVWLGGNIGRSLLDDLTEMQPSDLVVLELSSFQLENLAAIRRSPRIALLTNLSENHLDRHGDMEAYLDAKLNIFRFQTGSDHAVVNNADPSLVESVRKTIDKQTLHRFGQSNRQLADQLANVLRVPGNHNVANALAAYAVADIVGVKHDDILAGIARFTGLEHRLEFVAEIDRVRYYNDSKATTPAAAMLAVKAFSQPVIMLVGGSDKGAPFDELGQALAEKAKAVVCYGATGKRIADAVQVAKDSPGSPPVAVADSLENAVRQARSFAAPGDVIVLSPACASYDMFINYEQRGAGFKELILSCEKR